MAELNQKLVDRWLGIFGVVVGILFYLLPKTPIIVVVLLVFLAALLFHPIWNFSWIKKSLARRVIALLAMVILLFVIGVFIWPEPLRTISRNKEPPLTQADTNLTTTSIESQKPMIESQESIQGASEVPKTKAIPNVPQKPEQSRTSLKEMPEIAARIMRPKGFAIVLENVSQSPGTIVRDAQLSLFIWDLDIDGSEPLLRLTKRFTGDSIRKEEWFWAVDLTQLPQPAIPGDRLFGGLTVGCLECVRSRGYVINMVYGQGGSFIEYPKGEYPDFDKIRQYLPEIRERPESFFIMNFPESSVQVITDP